MKGKEPGSKKVEFYSQVRKAWVVWFWLWNLQCLETCMTWTHFCTLYLFSYLENGVNGTAFIGIILLCTFPPTSSCSLFYLQYTIYHWYSINIYWMNDWMNSQINGFDYELYNVSRICSKVSDISVNMVASPSFPFPSETKISIWMHISNCWSSNI